MDITTIVTNYLANYNYITGQNGRSFLVKSQSGYYFPCSYAFVTFANAGNSSYLNFVKKYDDDTNSYPCTQVDILTEEPNCDVLLNYHYPQSPYGGTWYEHTLQ